MLLSFGRRACRALAYHTRAPARPSLRHGLPTHRTLAAMAHTYRDGDVAVDAEVVIACVVEAASAILQIYDADDASWGVVSKSDESPLTKADLAANAVICERLAKAYPAIPIVSEETKQAPYDERRGWRHCCTS